MSSSGETSAESGLLCHEAELGADGFTEVKELQEECSHCNWKWDRSPRMTEAPYLLVRVRMGVTVISGVQKVSPDSSIGKSDT